MARFSLIVTSDKVYRGERRDEVTPLVSSILEGTRHVLVYARVVPNNPAVIRSAVLDAASRSDIVVVTGGTGLSKRDVSVDVLERISPRRLDGFGEAHRLRSLESVRHKAILSRAGAYQVGSSLVAVSPGSLDAVRVTMEVLLEIADHVREMIHGASHWDTQADGKRS